MKKKLFKYIKFIICMWIILSLVVPSYASLSASDGSAFVTKAEFDSALADFNSRLTSFEAGINSKIDSQVTSYLDRNGIWSGREQDLTPFGNNYNCYLIPELNSLDLCGIENENSYSFKKNATRAKVCNVTKSGMVFITGHVGAFTDETGSTYYTSCNHRWYYNRQGASSTGAMWHHDALFYYPAFSHIKNYGLTTEQEIFQMSLNTMLSWQMWGTFASSTSGNYSFMEKTSFTAGVTPYQFAINFFVEKDNSVVYTPWIYGFMPHTNHKWNADLERHSNTKVEAKALMCIDSCVVY